MLACNVGLLSRLTATPPESLTSLYVLRASWWGHALVQVYAAWADVAVHPCLPQSTQVQAEAHLSGAGRRRRPKGILPPDQGIVIIVVFAMLGCRRRLDWAAFLG